jgi:hypothetical protein
VSTQADVVILALVARFQGAGALAGVRVADGPQVDSDPSTEWLFVGYDGAVASEFVEGVVIEQDMMTFARGKQEKAEVKCAAVVVSGDSNIVPVRQRALAITSAAEDAVRADMTLNGLVQHAFVSGVTYIPSQTDAGAKVRVVFTVTYQAQF